jgi:hypothetical protein
LISAPDVIQSNDLQNSILTKLDQEELEVIYLTKCMQASSVDGKTRNFIGIRQTLKTAPKRKSKKGDSSEVGPFIAQQWKYA